MELILSPICSVSGGACSILQKEFLCFKLDLPPRCFLKYSRGCKLSFSRWQSLAISAVRERGQGSLSLVASDTSEKKKLVKRTAKKQHHLWKKRDSASSGNKALTLVQIISRLPDDKETVYNALDQWAAWETEFPVIAAAKALRILSKRNQWKRFIQVAKWMLSKGQGATMATYDGLLLAFDMDGRVDEAKNLWEIILQQHNRSVSRKLFSRMISLYDHHNMPNSVIEVFADMEELGIKPDQDTLRRIARAFRDSGQDDKRSMALMRYQMPYKYIHFKGERVRVRNSITNGISSSKTSQSIP